MANLRVLSARLTLRRKLDEDLYHIFNIGYYNSNIRIYVKETNKMNDRGKMVTTKPLFSINARLLLRLMEDLDANSGVIEFGFKQKGIKFEGEKKLDIYIPLLDIYVGRKETKSGDLINYLKIATDDGYKAVFPFLPNLDMIELYKNGEKIESKSDISDLWLKAFIRTYSEFLINIPEDQLVEGARQSTGSNKINTNDDITDISDII